MYTYIFVYVCTSIYIYIYIHVCVRVFVYLQEKQALQDLSHSLELQEHNQQIFGNSSAVSGAVDTHTEQARASVRSVCVCGLHVYIYTFCMCVFVSLCVFVSVTPAPGDKSPGQLSLLGHYVCVSVCLFVCTCV